MRLAHISDCHGHFPDIHFKNNIIINSGDWFPDCSSAWSKKSVKEERQKEYFYKNINKIKSWIGSKPYFFINGNHDFVKSDDLENMFQTNGINAKSLENKIVSYENLTMYGFPYAPYINGNFNYELTPDDMVYKVNELINILDTNFVDVLVLHCPIKGELSSETFTDYGNLILRDKLLSLDKDKIPGLILCGHLHEASGVKYSYDFDSLIINSALTINSIDY